MPSWFPTGKPIGTPGSCVLPGTQPVFWFRAELHSPLPCWSVSYTFGAWFWTLSCVHSLHKREPLSRNSFQLRYIKDSSNGRWKHPTWWRTRFLDLVNALIPDEIRWTCLAGWVSCSLLSRGTPGKLCIWYKRTKFPRGLEPVVGQGSRNAFTALLESLRQVLQCVYVFS